MTPVLKSLVLGGGPVTAVVRIGLRAIPNVVIDLAGRRGQSRQPVGISYPDSRARRIAVLPTSSPSVANASWSIP
jgi:hypothetical protein